MSQNTRLLWFQKEPTPGLVSRGAKRVFPLVSIGVKPVVFPEIKPNLVQEKLNASLLWFQEELTSIWFQEEPNLGLVSRGAKLRFWFQEEPNLGLVSRGAKLRFGFKRSQT